MRWLAALFVLWGGAVQASEALVETLHYEMLLASYCGLLTVEGESGYDSRLA